MADVDLMSLLSEFEANNDIDIDTTTKLSDSGRDDQDIDSGNSPSFHHLYIHLPVININPSLVVCLCDA